MPGDEEQRTLTADGGSVIGESIDARLRVTLDFDDTVSEYEARDVLRNLLGQEITVDLDTESYI